MTDAERMDRIIDALMTVGIGATSLVTTALLVAERHWDAEDTRTYGAFTRDWLSGLTAELVRRETDGGTLADRVLEAETETETE